MKYLKNNHNKLKDLRLAIMGYYHGENKIKDDIKKYQTRDPWILRDLGGYKTPYLARVMAAAIILKYPELVE